MGSLKAAHLPKHQATFLNLRVQVMACCGLETSFLLLKGKALEMGLVAGSEVKMPLVRNEQLALDNEV